MKNALSKNNEWKILYGNGNIIVVIMKFDVIIRDPTIVDGTGEPSYRGSIGIKRDKIVEVGDVAGDAVREISGSGLVACPGFIDPHSHADLALLHLPLAENLVMQGVTTFLGGNCGLSMAPLGDLFPSQFARAHVWWHEVESDEPGPPPFLSLDEYGGILEEKLGFVIDWRSFDGFLSKVERTGISINYAPLVGHNTTRIAVMGEDFKRTATPEEVGEMKVHVEEAMRSGAIGLSSFFDPSPGEYASIEEVVALARVAGKYGGLYVPHTRHIQSQWPSDDPEEYGYGIYHGTMEDVWVGRYRGYLEAMEISRMAGIPLHIVHLSNAFIIPQPHPEYLDEAAANATLELIDEALERGLDVTFDVITCDSSIASQAPMIEALSRWLNQHGKEGLVEKLKEGEFREEVKRVHDSGRLKFGMVHTRADPYWMDCFKILSCRKGEYEGKTIGEISRGIKKDPLEAMFDILVDDPDATWIQFLDKRGMLPALSVFIKHPLAMPCTDMSIYDLDSRDGSVQPPPIAFGLYPHYIRTFVKEKGVLLLEEAVRKATYLPAQRFGLKNRGIISEGMYADIVLIDFEKIRMMGDFIEPARAPEGVEYVLVNGTIVYKERKHTRERPGRVLRRE